MYRTFAMLLMLAALASAWPAAAQPATPPDPRGQRSGPPPGRPMPPAREASFGGHPPSAPPERMTPDERRQLRQDIHQHGREVYRPQRPQQEGEKQ